MVPLSLVQRLTVPVVVQSYNRSRLQNQMRRGQVLFLQRAQRLGQSPERMRAVHHIAVQNLGLREGDCVLRDGHKFVLGQETPLMGVQGVPLPVQPLADAAAGLLEVTLCFGDRVLDRTRGRWLSPLDTIVWPQLDIGDTILMVPPDGFPILVNRQPTLVQESMLPRAGAAPWWDGARPSIRHAHAHRPTAQFRRRGSFCRSVPTGECPTSRQLCPR